MKTTALVDLKYFQDTFKTDHDIPTESEAQFYKLAQLASNFILSICGIEKYVEAEYETYQIELLKQSVCIWVEHWINEGFFLQQGGTKSYQALGYNFSVTSPQDPEFIPVSIKANLRRAKLYSSFYALDYKGNIFSENKVDDTLLLRLQEDK